VADRPCNGHTLLFAAGKFRRPVLHAFFKPNKFQAGADALIPLVRRRSGEAQGKIHIFICGHGGHQRNGLKDKTVRRFTQMIPPAF
jgi:hypothetical protein